jgi:hypothetical protein
LAVSIAGEGPLDLAILRRLLGDAGLRVDREIWGTDGKGGKDGMTPRLTQWAAGAIGGRAVVVLRDLDDDAPCAAMLRDRLMPHLPPAMLLRIAVHMAEAWLVADRERLAAVLSVTPRHLPTLPDDHPNPKRALVEAAPHSGDALVRAGLPPSGAGRKQGPDYNATLIDFVYRVWQPEDAALRSPSLNRALTRIADLRDHLRRSG